jgi:hypothetical protein
MENPGQVPNEQANDGVDQSSDQGGSDPVREDQVPGVKDLAAYGYSSTPLEPDAEYRIWGSYINAMCDVAIEHFNNSPTAEHGQASYSQAFWNGYGVAAGILRNTIRSYPLAPKVQ